MVGVVFTVRVKPTLLLILMSSYGPTTISLRVVVVLPGSTVRLASTVVLPAAAWGRFFSGKREVSPAGRPDDGTAKKGMATWKHRPGQQGITVAHLRLVL